MSTLTAKSTPPTIPRLRRCSLEPLLIAGGMLGVDEGSEPLQRPFVADSRTRDTITLEMVRGFGHTRRAGVALGRHIEVNHSLLSPDGATSLWNHRRS